MSVAELYGAWMPTEEGFNEIALACKEYSSMKIDGNTYGTHTTY